MFRYPLHVFASVPQHPLKKTNLAQTFFEHHSFEGIPGRNAERVEDTKDAYSKPCRAREQSVRIRSVDMPTSRLISI